MAKYIDAEKLKAEIKHLKIDVYDEAHQFDLGARNSLTSLESFIDSLQQEQIDMGEVSDGYHTFNELYYYRMLYNAAFFNLLPKEWVHKSKRHHTGEECFGGGWFIVMANLPTGQVSNHYELKDWDLFKVPEKEFADEWDGHTPQEAAERIKEYLQQEQPMPDSTKLIELWHEDKEKLKEKDFRDDPWRLAYNAFLCGFGRGIAVNKQKQPSFSSNLDEAAKEYSKSLDVELQSDSPDCFEEIIPAFKAGAEWGEKNAYKVIMKKADEVRDKRFDTDYEVKIEPSAGFDLSCINVYREGKLVGQYVESKEEKKLPEDLEEAAKKYDEAESWRWEAPKYPRREAFEAGANWQKRQIIKDTIDIKVIESYNPTCEPNERLHGISFIYDCKNDNQYLIAGDRAKIIIVNEEEQ